MIDFSISHPVQATILRAYPKSIAGIIERRDNIARQPIFPCVCRKLAASHLGQSSQGTYPQSTIRTPSERPDKIAPESIRLRKGMEARIPPNCKPAPGTEPNRAIWVSKQRTHQVVSQTIGGGESGNFAVVNHVQPILRSHQQVSSGSFSQGETRLLDNPSFTVKFENLPEAIFVRPPFVPIQIVP